MLRTVKSIFLSVLKGISKSFFFSIANERLLKNNLNCVEGSLEAFIKNETFPCAVILIALA